MPNRQRMEPLWCHGPALSSEHPTGSSRDPLPDVSPADAGVWLSRARGSNLGEEVIDLAIERGFDPHAIEPAGGWRDHEQYQALQHNAEEFLNEHCAPRGYGFGVNPQGDWGLWNTRRPDVPPSDNGLVLCETCRLAVDTYAEPGHRAVYKFNRLCEECVMRILDRLISPEQCDGPESVYTCPINPMGPRRPWIPDEDLIVIANNTRSPR